MYIAPLHCIYSAPSRILAFWLMLSVLRTTLNKAFLSYLILCKHSSHSSVNVIKKTISSNKKFNFSTVSEETFLKYMNKLDVKKGHRI